MLVLHPRGFVTTKQTNGIKRHLAVDTLGFPFFLLYQSQRHWRRDWLRCSHNINYFKAKPVNIPKITIWITAIIPKQSAKHRKKFIPRSWPKFGLSAPKTFKAEKLAQGKSGFVAVATRWVVERSNAWMERCKCLVKSSGLDHANFKTQSYQAHA